jgi:Family of unknown function (DUF695)
MKRLFGLIAIACATTLVKAEPLSNEQWWSYLASYDAGPGSILLNLALRKQAPLTDYPHIVVTGTTYSSSGKKGLPEATDFGRLNALEEKVIAAIAKKSQYIHAGTFTHNFEQLQYVYVKNPSGISQALADVYREHCPGCKTYINIKNDETWSAYSKFLFPNEATLKHCGVRLQ